MTGISKCLTGCIKSFINPLERVIGVIATTNLTDLFYRTMLGKKEATSTIALTSKDSSYKSGFFAFDNQKPAPSLIRRNTV